MSSFTAEERSEIEAAVRRGDSPACPACGGELDRRDVSADGVAYVRRRTWLLCRSCRRSGAVDIGRSLRDR